MSNFITDTSGTNQYIIPLIVIYKGIRADDFEIIDQVSDNDKIFLSTQNIQFDGKYFQPLLNKAPKITQTIDTKSKKYRIQTASLDINNSKFHGKRFSDNIKDITNCAVRVYFKTQSCKTLDDCVLVSQSTITRYKQKSTQLTLSLEDITLTSLQKLLPELTPDTVEFASEDRLKPFPIVYGHVDRSPLIKKVDPLVSTSEGEESVDILIADTLPISKFITQNSEENIPLVVQSKIVEGSPLYIYESDYVNLSNRVPEEYTQLLEFNNDLPLYEIQNNQIITTPTFKSFQVTIQKEYDFDVPAFGRILRQIVGLDGKVKNDRVVVDGNGATDNNGEGYAVGGRLFATEDWTDSPFHASSLVVTNTEWYEDMWEWYNYWAADRFCFPFHNDSYEDWTPDIHPDNLENGTSLESEAIEDSILSIWRQPYYNVDPYEDGTLSGLSSDTKRFINHIKNDDTRGLCWSAKAHSNGQQDGTYVYWELILDNLKIKSKCITWYLGGVAIYGGGQHFSNHYTPDLISGNSGIWGGEVPIYPHEPTNEQSQFPALPYSAGGFYTFNEDMISRERTDGLLIRDFAKISDWTSTDQFKSIKIGQPKYTHEVEDEAMLMNTIGSLNYAHILQDIFIEDSHIVNWYANVYGRKNDNLYWKPFNSFLTETLPEHISELSVMEVKDYIKSIGYDSNDTGGQSGWLVVADEDLPNQYNLQDITDSMEVVPSNMYYLSFNGSFAYYSDGSWNDTSFNSINPFILFTETPQRINLDYSFIRMHYSLESSSWEEGFAPSQADDEVRVRYKARGWKSYIYQPEVNINDMVEQPHEIIINLLSHELNYNSDNFDEQLIKDIFIAHQGWKMAFTLTEQNSLKETIENLATNTKIFPRYSSSGKFTFDTFKNYYNMSDVNKVIKKYDVIDWTFDISNIEDIYSQHKLLYKYDYGKEDFSRVVTPSINTIDYDFNDYTAMTEFLYGYLDNEDLIYNIKNLYNKTDEENENQLEAMYIRDRYTAEEYKKYIMMQSLNQKLLINLSLSTKYSDLEVGNIIYIEQLSDELAFGHKYFAYESKGGQLLYPFYIITSVNKTTDRVDVKCERLHRLQYGLPAFFVTNLITGNDQPQTQLEIEEAEDYGEIFSNNINYETDMQSISEDTPEDYDQSLIIEWYNGNVIEGTQGSSVRLDVIQTSEYSAASSWDFLIEDSGVASDTETPNFNITSYQDGNGNGYVIVTAKEDNMTDTIKEGSISIILNESVYNRNFAQKVFEEPSYEQGDINRDGIINILDVVMMINFILGDEELDEQQQQLGDMNGDGGINIQDILLLLDRITGT